MKTFGKQALNLLLVVAISVALLFGMDRLSASLIHSQEMEEVRSNFSGILAGEAYEEMETGEAEGIRSAYRVKDKAGKLLGYAVTAAARGYGGDVEVHVALSADLSRFLGLRVGSHQETENIGAKVAEETFYRQFDSLTAPAQVNGYTGLDKTPSPPAADAAAWRDGTYRAEQDGYDNDYRNFVEVSISEGKITAVNWDATKKDGSTTKKQESRSGSYVMTETGLKWHEQAKIMEDALLASQDPTKLILDEATGKTDAYAGVSISVGDFVTLSIQALNKAKTGAEGAGSGGNGGSGAVDAVSGATVSSKAVVRAANLAYQFAVEASKQS